MKLWLLLLTNLCTVLASAAQWQESLTETTPGSFPALRPFKAQYSFGWSAFTAASGDFRMAPNESGLLQLDVKSSTNGFVRTLWKMDAEHTSQIDPVTFLPVMVRQEETYSDEKRTTVLTFEEGKVIRTRDRVPVEPGKNKRVKKIKISPVHDLHGALHFIRSQPLKTGDVYRLVVFPSNAAYLAQLTVYGRGKVEVAGRKQNGIRLDLKLWRINDDDLKLKPYSKFKRAAAWVSDDADRMLLKVEGEIFVGKVWAELKSVQYLQ